MFGHTGDKSSSEQDEGKIKRIETIIQGRSRDKSSKNISNRPHDKSTIEEQCSWRLKGSQFWWIYEQLSSKQVE